MQYIYTAIFTPIEDGNGFYARIPDLPGCISTGKDLSDAIDQIEDALNGWLAVAEDEGIDIAKPTQQFNLDIPDNAFCSLVRADTLVYRHRSHKNDDIKTQNLPDKYVYPAIFTDYGPGKEIAVEFPDLGVTTSGVDDADALQSARELLGITMLGIEEDKEKAPSPSRLSSLKLEKGETSSLVDIYMPTLRSSIHS